MQIKMLSKNICEHWLYTTIKKEENTEQSA